MIASGIPNFANIFSFVSLSTTLWQSQFFSGTIYDVRVVNGFTDNSSLVLVIWCSSQHNDLGGRALQAGDDFSWSLKTNLWATTLFHCTMKWDQRRTSFEAFQVQRDSQRCGPFRTCFWLVKEDGFYFSNDQVNWKKDFSWS
ncbi:hypothetical protein CK203_043902 [Vitis vinifera]|uniref:S-protein homolog n=1 Tax=Vitis vinifera TaxID=29760 RepID=A0A438HVE4_VITVI|nr:hypothetical protein CK203_043902 [Vitis vinifera]